jgi:hypothetical protein
MVMRCSADVCMMPGWFFSPISVSAACSATDISAPRTKRLVCGALSAPGPSCCTGPLRLPCAAAAAARAASSAVLCIIT